MTAYIPGERRRQLQAQQSQEKQAKLQEYDDKLNWVKAQEAIGRLGWGWQTRAAEFAMVTPAAVNKVMLGHVRSHRLLEEICVYVRGQLGMASDVAANLNPADAARDLAQLEAEMEAQLVTLQASLDGLEADLAQDMILLQAAYEKRRVKLSRQFEALEADLSRCRARLESAQLSADMAADPMPARLAPTTLEPSDQLRRNRLAAVVYGTPMPVDPNAPVAQQDQASVQDDKDARDPEARAKREAEIDERAKRQGWSPDMFNKEPQ